ncbi:MAG: metallophosphoesterase [Planctomycetota bacterium]
MEKSIFVLSDLHIGDGSKKDNLSCRYTEDMLYRFLDHVHGQNGELVINGDFLELWRFNVADVLEERWGLLERLTDLDVTYVLGNHDGELEYVTEEDDLYHPFFEAIDEPFVRIIGGKRFKFMHGHEADPFSGVVLRRLCDTLEPLDGKLSLGEGGEMLVSDAVYRILIEIGELGKHTWFWVRRFGSELFEELGLIEADREVKRCIRTRKLLAAYHEELSDGLYDVAIAGHTHKAGRCRQWYFNSGSWMRGQRNFLRIHPDGSVDVCHWEKKGAVRDQTIIAEIKNRKN